jgi:hypothetical protein
LPSSLTRTHPSTSVLLHLPTCVGLRYGRGPLPPRGFSWKPGSARSARVAPRLPHASALARLHAWPPLLQRDGGPTAPRPPAGTFPAACGNGISTVCPSPTPFGLGLGPTNPTWMSLPSEPLGIRWAAFSAASRYSCRHSHSCTLHDGSPRRFSACTTLPYRSARADPAASARGFSPATLSAQRHSTSELLRTLSRMAASKPTSWLSSRHHHLAHLATLPGP